MHFLLWNDLVAIPISNLKRIRPNATGTVVIETLQGDEYPLDEAAPRVMHRINRRIDNGKTYSRVWQENHRPGDFQE